MANADVARTAVSPAKAQAELYVEITASWYWSNPRGGHIWRPIQAFVLAPDFHDSVARWPGATHGRIIAACARIVSLYRWELVGMKVANHAEGSGTRAGEGLDPVTAAWYPLEGTSEVGVHFWQLGCGLTDLRSVAPFNQAPALEFGRFAMAERKRDDRIRRALERMARE